MLSHKSSLDFTFSTVSNETLPSRGTDFNPQVLDHFLSHIYTVSHTVSVRPPTSDTVVSGKVRNILLKKGRVRDRNRV